MFGETLLDSGRKVDGSGIVPNVKVPFRRAVLRQHLHQMTIQAVKFIENLPAHFVQISISGNQNHMHWILWPSPKKTFRVEKLAKSQSLLCPAVLFLHWVVGVI